MPAAFRPPFLTLASASGSPCSFSQRALRLCERSPLPTFSRQDAKSAKKHMVLPLFSSRPLRLCESLSCTCFSSPSR